MYSRPATLFGAKFFGDTNIIPGTVTGTDKESTLVDIGSCTARVAQSGVNVGESIFLSIRPELMRIEKAASTAPSTVNSVEGAIADITFIGSRVVYTVQSERISLKYQTSKPVHTKGIGNSDIVRLSWAPEDVVMLKH